MQIVDIDDIKPDTHNLNKGTEDGANLIQSSLQDVGLGKPILLDEGYNIIAGNKTFAAAKARGTKKVKVIDTNGQSLVVVIRKDMDLDDKNDQRARMLAIYDNETSKRDFNLDVNEFDNLLQQGLDASDYFYEYELEEILSRINEPVEITMTLSLHLEKKLADKIKEVLLRNGNTMEQGLLKLLGIDSSPIK